MWMFRGRTDHDSESDYDSDEYSYETDSEEEEPEAEVGKETEKVSSEEEEEYEGYILTKEVKQEEEEVVVPELEEEEEEELEEETLEEEEELVEELEEEEDESDDDEESEEEEEDDEESEEEEEGPTSLEEKESLLALAVEHDRVDILKAILASDQDRLTLLPSLYPLHVAVLFGSTQCVSCLLRMGANPALRPTFEDPTTSTTEETGTNPLTKYPGVSAWELAFGRDTSSSETLTPAKGSSSSSSWFRRSPSEEPKLPVSMLPSKRESIRHAFTAEALRCIGSDEVERLQQLLTSGMPASQEVGGKTLHGWCVEMGATQCEELTRDVPEDDDEEGETEAPPPPTTTSPPSTQEESSSSVTPSPPVTGLQRSSSRSSNDPLSGLVNRLEELECLAKSLSTCLDNLAEEVSVCHGLLLLGGGASALATHVRSLKALLECRHDDLAQAKGEWSHSEGELRQWMERSGMNLSEEIAASLLLGDGGRSNSLGNLSNAQGRSDEEVEAQRQQLTAQIGASENKIRKLRASIADLSEENTRDLAEVERRGLTGGINLVRSLREEIREVEFQLSEAKAGDAACRAHLSLLKSRVEGKHKSPQEGANDEARKQDETAAAKINGQAPSPSSEEVMNDSVDSSGVIVLDENVPETSVTETSGEKRPSEKIAAGESDAIVVSGGSSRGYMPLDIWQILLRIIGFGSSTTPRPPNSGSSNVMIV